jgi:hypothetical protein
MVFPVLQAFYSRVVFAAKLKEIELPTRAAGTPSTVPTNGDTMTARS